MGCWFAFQLVGRSVWFLWVDETPLEKASSSMDGEGVEPAPWSVITPMVERNAVAMYIEGTYVGRTDTKIGLSETLNVQSKLSPLIDIAFTNLFGQLGHPCTFPAYRLVALPTSARFSR